MIRLLFTGDWHIRGTNPRNRIDNYKEALKAKLREVFALAKKHEVKAIIAPGDIFDRPEVSIAVLLEFVEVLNESPVMIYTTPGNHDVYGYNLETFERSSLKLLELLVPKLMVFVDLNIHRVTDPMYTANGREVLLSFTPYSANVDVNGYGYSPEYGPELTTDHTYKIQVTHGMLLDHDPPFDRYTHIEKVETTADMVLTGHCHIGYGVYKRKDGVIFCNPGALMRMAASTTEIERPVQVAIITVDKGEGDIQLLKLASAKPGDEVLDRSKIEAEKQRQYSMEQFSALIQRKTGEKVLLDVNQIIETIASQENYSPEVVKTALETIDAQRELIQV